MMKTKLPVALLFAIASQYAFADDCGCDHSISLNGPYRWDGSAVLPGEKVCFQAGVRTQNLLIDNLSGTEESPIVLQNCQGKTTIRVSNEVSAALSIYNSKHFRLTGSGDPDIKYGLEFDGSRMGVSVTQFSTEAEIDHLEIKNTEFSGLVVKTDPTCDARTWRENFTMRNISIHDNYAHNMKTGEGFYIGNSFYSSGMYRKSCDKLVYPHAIENLKFFNNRTYNTGAEGIQVGSATVGTEIYANKIEKYGQRPFNGHSSQQNGMQIGAGTGGKIYGNYIENGPANGLIVLGLGNNVIFNNVIVDAGEYGMFVDERPPALVDGPGSGFKIFNNTIVSPDKDGVLIYAELVEKNIIKNNLFVDIGSGKSIAKGGPSEPVVEQSHNLSMVSLDDAKFVDPASGNYQLRLDSPAINAGGDLVSEGINFDFLEHLRPGDGVFDVGAYEGDSQTDRIVATSTIVSPSCFQASNGSISLSVSGGHPPYVFDWLHGGENASVDALPAGEYSVGITDSKGFKANYQYLLRQPEALEISHSVTPNCFDGNGAIRSFVSGGTAPYTFVWSNGATSGDISNLSSGEYQVTVTDLKSCQLVSETVVIAEENCTSELIVPVYRINAGGVIEQEQKLDWGLDKSDAPSPYLTSPSAKYTSGPNNCSFPEGNVTDAPDSIFCNHRSDLLWGEDMAWQFPVVDGEYKVSLYFKEDGGADTRIFSVELEGEMVLEGFDAAAEQGTFPQQKDFFINIDDGNINLVFRHIEGAPRVNGIQVQRVYRNTPPEFVDFEPLELDEGSTHSLVLNANDEDSDKLIFSSQNLPAFVSILTTGPDSAVLSLTPGFEDAGSYSITVAVEDSHGNVDETEIALVINDVVISTRQVIYRVNAGGAYESDADLEWSADKQWAPSPYLASESAKYTTGSDTWQGGENPVDAPDNIFQNYRYDLAWGDQMGWEFPVAEGRYEVSLYFRAPNSDVRIFDVDIEGVSVLEDYDLYLSSGLIPTVERFVVDIVDSAISIDFTSKQGSPLINGIEIHRINSN